MLVAFLFVLLSDTDGSWTDFKASLQLFDFGIKAGSEHISLEKSLLWCGRLTVHGSREVALVSVADLQEYMKTVNIIGVDVKSFFRDVRSEGLKKSG